jgi:hypothetical protein
MNQKTIIVLGMFRSGTSMVAGILDRLGVAMGDQMYPESRANPLGYFEDKEFMDLNRRIVDDAGGSLNDPPPLEKILYLQGKYRPAIQNMLRDNPPVWGWKDPVTALTIHLYADYLVHPYIIVCSRNPEDVALSYSKMVGLSISEVKALRRTYNDSIDTFLSNYPDIPRLHLQYEDVLNDPVQWINQIISFTELKPISSQRRKAYDFVKPRSQMLVHRWKNMIQTALSHPMSVPSYILKRIKHALGRYE